MRDLLPPQPLGGTPGASAFRDADWHDLARRVHGRVYRPGEAGFRERSELFNERYEHKRPAGVVSVTSEGDVRQAVLWARENAVPVVVRSGGHSFAGYSVNDGLVIDLSPLSLVVPDASSGLVAVGGGARVGHVHEALRPYEMAFPTGTNPLVGIGGLVLGGGCEYLSRASGLTADALVETTIVTADGRLLTCSERENSDLFWACRGGGGGNFGVNVSFTFQAHPAPAVATFSLAWRSADAVRVLDAMQQVMATAPDELSARLGVSNDPTTCAPGGQGPLATVVGQYLGSSDEVLRILDPVLAVAEPLSRTVADRTFWEAKSDTVHATSAGAFALRSNYVKEPVPREALETIVDWVRRWPGSSNPDGGGVGLFSWGGAINRVPVDATAVVHRDTLFLVSMDTSWTSRDTPQVVQANLRWLDGMREALLPRLCASSYQNFVDPALEDWREAYYGHQYERLVEVKRAYDPDDVFRFDQSIGS